MGKPYEAKKFKAIVDACGLGPDLKILPGGKNCEVRLTNLLILLT
jgi:hypothetical protein